MECVSARKSAWQVSAHALASTTDNAPATKAGITTLILTSLFGWFVLDRSGGGIDADTLPQLQLWKLFTSQWACENPVDLAFCIAAFYSSRHFERMLGSAKSCALATMVATAAATVQVVLHSTPLGPQFLGSTAGPYAVLGAALVLFARLVPRRVHHQFTLLGVTFSDKAFTYLTFAHVLCAHGQGSLLPAAVGAVIAEAFLRNTAGLGGIRVPSPLSALASKTLLHVFTSEHPVAREARKAAQRAARERRQMEAVVRETMRRRAGGRRGGAGGGAPNNEDQMQAALAQLLEQQQQQQQVGGGGNMPTAGTGGSGADGGGAEAFVPPLAEVDEEAVQRLVGMGFEAEAARQALAATYNDENAAVNRLVGGS